MWGSHLPRNRINRIKSTERLIKWDKKLKKICSLSLNLWNKQKQGPWDSPVVSMDPTEVSWPWGRHGWEPKGWGAIVRISQEVWWADQDSTKACPTETRTQGSHPDRTPPSGPQRSSPNSRAQLEPPHRHSVLSEPRLSQLLCFIQLHRTGWWLTWFCVLRIGERMQVRVTVPALQTQAVT